MSSLCTYHAHPNGGQFEVFYMADLDLQGAFYRGGYFWQRTYPEKLSNRPVGPFKTALAAFFDAHQ